MVSSLALLLWVAVVLCVDADRVCTVKVDADVRHVDPLMSRVEETSHLLCCITIQLL